VETSEVILQILSTFRFVDIVSEIEDYLPLYLDYNTGTGGFGYTSERIGLVKEVEDINGDGVNEVFATASGSGGSCVGGSNYSILYSPKDKEYFIRAGSFLPPPPPPVDNNTNFCTNIEQNQAWEGCGNDYVSAICYSNNLKEEENTAFKEYLDNVISQE
jgi:hypothetical protein